METGVNLPRHWLLRALQLETDRAHGATHLSREAVRAFREAIEEAWTPDADPNEVRGRLEAYRIRLERTHRTMVSMAHRLHRCAAALENGRDAALAEADAALAELDTALESLIANGSGLFRPGLRVLTHGFSETVFNLLTHHGDSLELITVCEGRPLNDGVRLAAQLAELAMPVRLITEGQLELFARNQDLAVLGADRVLPDGGIVNRAGTGVVARICEAHRVPFYVAADRSKWVSQTDELARFARERRSPAEVLPDPPRGVEVANVMFDFTPAHLVSGYITEDGIVERPSQGAPAPLVPAAA
jgi:translation initiation factor eIF-2B subunit delta